MEQAAFDFFTQAPEKLSTDALYKLLRARYPQDAYAFLGEVANATGWKKDRSADALVFSLWPSRGLTLTGFELKISRSDWLKEYRNPAKADAFVRYCDHWYIVAANDKIVQPGELPPAWGLMIPRGKNLVAKVEAPKLEPIPLDMNILAGIFRSVCAQLTSNAQISRQLTEMYSQGLKDGERNVAYVKEEIKRKEQSFRDEFGCDFQEWHYPEIKEAIALVRDCGLDHMRTRLRSLQKTATMIAEMVQQALDGTAETVTPNAARPRSLPSSSSRKR